TRQIVHGETARFLRIPERKRCIYMSPKFAYRAALFIFAVATLGIFVPVAAFAQSTGSTSQSLNTRLRPVPLTSGTVVIGMTGQFATAPSDSFVLQKRVFTGTTNCNCPMPPLCTSPGGGPVSFVTVSPSSTDSTVLATTDSLLLQGAPG